MQRWLFLLYLFILSHMIGSAVAAWALWRASKTNGYTIEIRLLAGVFFGVFAFFLGNLIGNSFGFEQQPIYTTGYAWSYWTGHSILSASVWAFVLYIFGRRKK